jgi:large subunit ribosomal protein L5
MANTTPAIQLDTNQFFGGAQTALKSAHPDQNIFSLPNLASVTINVGVGRLADNKVKQDVADYLQKLTSQVPKKVPSKISIASFKVRKGDIVGLMVTLRGQKAKDFLLQLIYITLPRTRDFKGVKLTAFDAKYSTYSLGIESTSIFPSIGFDASVNFGMQVNIKFSNKTEMNREYLTLLKFPFSKVK